MGRWLRRLLIGGALIFILGWALVLSSGYGGDSTGGSELVWRIGGVMVYAAVATLPVTLLLATAVVCAARHRRGRDH